jgi:hypothetical protein
MLAGYLYAFHLGLRCFVNPLSFLPKTFAVAATTTTSETPLPAVLASQLAICVLPLIYALDSSLAACPLHWCCMRNIPPKNVLQHHLPFIAGMLPSAALTVFANREFSSPSLSVMSWRQSNEIFLHVVLLMKVFMCHERAMNQQ